ncbi:MAG: elongation factor G [Proteobacteria bacterium]|nr:elongation factor G [Pseudomonadota bacterium]
MSTKALSAPRVAAIVGPYLSGKTSLLEALLSHAGAIGRKGSVRDGNSVGDASPDSRERGMSTEMNVATVDYLDETWTFIDCPGSIELAQEALNALMISDAAVVCVDADQAKAVAVGGLLRQLDDNDIPHMIFINKMDVAEKHVRETLEALQAVSAHPLVLREIPIRDGDAVTGHVDLVSERAFRWVEGKPSELIELPEQVRDRESEARAEMLESLADFDDQLLESLLEDVIPSSDEVYAKMSAPLKDNKIVPVFFGSALHDHGIRRLLKALRHEAPDARATAARLGVGTKTQPLARVFKTVHAGHAGKLSYVRVWSGEIADGMTLNGERVGGVQRILGTKMEKLAKAEAGMVASLGRLEKAATGDVLAAEADAEGGLWSAPLTPLFSLAVRAHNRRDEVKLSVALSKLLDEDPSLTAELNQDTGEYLLSGQGEVHLKIALDRFRTKFGIDVSGDRPQVPYKETIRKGTSIHARHKKQSGGHGEFGDVHVDIKPLPRGSGFQFSDTITGGVVPKQYIPAVEDGVKEYMARGPLGFPVVDVAVVLTDGQYHNVDSSEMAFRKAAQQAMREGMPECQPVLLEPICEVVIALPRDFTSNVQRLVSGRRGHILGFDAKAGWDGWDEVKVMMPQSEMHDLIIELRSLTQGLGTYSWRFDHLQELVGKEADQVVGGRSHAAQ